MLSLFLNCSNMIACVWGLLGAGILKHFVCLTLRKFCQPDSETQPPYIEYFFFINFHPSFSLCLSGISSWFYLIVATLLQG